jgi:nicotinamidase-related amidase
MVFPRMLKNALPAPRLRQAGGFSVSCQSSSIGGIMMNPPFQIEKKDAILVMIDLQGALVKAMESDVVKRVIRNSQTLIAFAKEMGIPILITEQYPKGLGETIPEMKKDLEGIAPIEKMSFSCCRMDRFRGQLENSGRKEVILCGIEAHVCVLQTAAELLQQGYGVHVVADAVCSRRKLDWKTGLRWMEKKGAMILTTEIIAFQLLKEAGTDEFKRLSKLLK